MSTLCSYCNHVIKGSHRSSRCFTCDFWMEHVHHVHDKNIVRINGQHYLIENDTIPYSSFNGFAGRQFTIRFFDGRITTTTNLWHQGTIPDRFRERLPDNAEFIDT